MPRAWAVSLRWPPLPWKMCIRDRVCGVGPLLDRSIFALSGGEKQRIACASAWAMGPELFVLDEPSSNLDGEGIRQLREILKQLKKARKTVLMAEHRLWYAADLADRVFYLRGGQLQREYSGQNFLTLTEKERRSMGLRSIAEVPVSSPEPSPAAGADGLMVRELRATYNGAAVWEGVSFHAPRGQITAITGQNGAGKTTPVSYTHLDVYKRQSRNRAQSLAIPRFCR